MSETKTCRVCGQSHECSHAWSPEVRNREKQKTRLIKCQCPKCGYVARITAKWIAVGLPVCPCAEGELEPSKEEDDLPC